MSSPPPPPQQQNAPPSRAASSSSGDVHYIQGYLYKKTRDGRWQKRWFETTGCFLTYYKSKKMTKLLAALNLPQVGDIKVVQDAEEDAPRGCLFSIHLNDRDYLLKAADAKSAARWVQVLNQLKDGAKTGADDKRAAASVVAGGDAVAVAAPKSWSKARRLRMALCCCRATPVAS